MKLLCPNKTSKKMLLSDLNKIIGYTRGGKMKIKKLSAIIMALLFLVIFSVSMGCSKEKEKPSFIKKVREAEETMDKKNPRKKIEDPLREKNLAIAEQCSGKYEVCMEKCAKENSSDKCEGKCQKALSLCEKDIPDDLKTIK
jgi:hypothetical protein